MKKIVALISCICLLLSCNGQSTKNIENIPPVEFAEKINRESNPQIVDVRTPEEFSAGHLDNAVNIDWNGADFEQRAGKLDRSKPVFIYCKIGGRSRQAANRLSEMGFDKVYDLKGGFMKWESEGFAAKDQPVIGMTQQQYQELLGKDKTVLVSFNAKWCEPCRKMAPFIDKMTREMKDKVTIVRLDADQNKTLVSQMKIDTIPMLLLYRDQKIVWQHKGFISEDELKKQLP